MSAFRALPGSPSFPQLEQEILQFWDDNDIYNQSLQRRAEGPSFVFFEGQIGRAHV
jgi:isoleucyl-tRNA synthetase